MVHIGKILTLAAAVAFPLVASAPVASAATPAYVTRGQYVEELLTAVGVQPLDATAQNFSDVPPSSSYFGYIEAAYHAGITTGMTAPSNGKMGVFGVNQFLNRAEAAAFDLRAYDGGVASYVQSAPANLTTVNDTAFMMTGGVPQALRNDVFAAVDIGLMRGLADGTFGAAQDLTNAQTTHLIAQLKALEATGGSYNWRWIVAANGGLAEKSSANAMNFLADAVAGRPFSAVTSYIDPADAATLQTAYAQIAKGAAGYFNGGFDAGTANGTIKIVGGAFAAGVPISGGGWHGSTSVFVEAVSNSTGKPNSVSGNSPYLRLLDAVTTNSDGLVSQADTQVSAGANATISNGEPVAGVTMYLLGGIPAVYSNGEDAVAVVGGLGLAQVAGQ